MRAEPKELARRMKAMRKTVAEHDVNAWASSFLDSLDGTDTTHQKRVRSSDGRGQREP
jgi:trehalose 6-phosphate synthase